MTIYNNIPKTQQTSSSDLTIKVFDQYFNIPVEINHTELVAMQGFFENRGFGKDSAESTALVIITQAKKDGYSAMQIMDTLSGFDNVKISALVAEILNYNRFKTSSIGVTQQFIASDEVARNILP